MALCGFFKLSFIYFHCFATMASSINVYLRDGNSPSFTGGLLRGAGVFYFLLAHIVLAYVDIKLKVHFLVAILNISESVGS